MKDQTDVLNTDRDERRELRSVQKQRSGISLVQTEPARSITSLINGFIKI